MSEISHGRESLARAGLRPRLVEPDEVIDTAPPANDDWQPPEREPGAPGPGDEVIVAGRVRRGPLGWGRRSVGGSKAERS